MKFRDQNEISMESELQWKNHQRHDGALFQYWLIINENNAFTHLVVSEDVTYEISTYYQIDN